MTSTAPLPAMPYQLTASDFLPIEPSILTLPVTTFCEDGGYVGWGHLDAADFADAVNLLESFWGVVDDPRDRINREDVSYQYLTGSEVGGETRWQLCSQHAPGAVPVTFVAER